MVRTRPRTVSCQIDATRARPAGNAQNATGAGRPARSAVGKARRLDVMRPLRRPTRHLPDRESSARRRHPHLRRHRRPYHYDCPDTATTVPFAVQHPRPRFFSAPPMAVFSCRTHHPTSVSAPSLHTRRCVLRGAVRALPGPRRHFERARGFVPHRRFTPIPTSALPDSWLMPR